MANIKIPKNDLAVLKRISEIGVAQFNSLVSAIRAAKPRFSKKQFIHEVAEEVKTTHKSEIEAILRIVFILYTVKEKSKTTAKELANDATGALEESLSQENRISAKKIKLLSARIETLLSIEKSVSITAKANEIMTEQNFTFCRARILSDIRPIFTTSPDESDAAVIIHNLQIGYHCSGGEKHNEFYVALDTNDLQSLKSIIERAEKKTVVLERILKNSKVQYLKV